jgi:hypothetical protein
MDEREKRGIVFALGAPAIKLSPLPIILMEWTR